MALALETFINFESGTLHECKIAANDAAIVTDPAPPYEYETYAAVLPSFGDVKENALYIAPVPADLNKYVIGFYIRFHKVGSITEQFFFRWGNNSATEWDFHLRLEDDGAFSIYDTNEAHVATSSTGVFAANKWHLVELLFTRGDSGDLIIHVDDSEVLNTSGEDYDSVGAYDYSAFFMSQQGASPELVTIYIAGLYVYSGASSVDDFIGPFGSLTYRQDEDTATPDIGDDLDTGTWADVAEVPFNDVHTATYTNTMTPGDKGVMTTDYGGGAATPGPYGDDRITENDEILGASWLFRYSGGYVSGCYGKTPNGDPGVDNTTTTDAFAARTSPANVLIVSDNAGDVPTTDEYFQIGCQGYWGFRKDVPEMFDCLCSLLIKIAPTYRGITLGSGLAGRNKSRNILIG